MTILGEKTNQRFYIQLFKKGVKPGDRVDRHADSPQGAARVVEDAKASGLYRRAIVRERVLDTKEGFL